MNVVVWGLATLLLAIPLAAQSPALAHLNEVLGAREALSNNPANEAIYEKMDAVVRGINRTIDNRGDWISYYTVEDSALGQMTEVEQRIRELLVERSSGLLASSDRDIINSEISQCEDEVLDILKQTEFNTIKIFEPIVSDPAIVGAIADPERLTVEGVDSLLEFLSHQRTVAGTRAQTLKYEVSGDQIAGQNTQSTRDQIGLMAHLLMLK